MTKVVAVSGGFDPLHVGHVRYLKEAEKLGDELIVFLASDIWLMNKKGYFLMKFEERKEMIEAYDFVTNVYQQINLHDHSASESLAYHKPDIFAKGGDRTLSNLPQDEIDTCYKYDIEIITGVGGDKIQSSSKLIQKAFMIKDLLES